MQPYFLPLWSKEGQKGQCPFLVFPSPHSPRRGFSSPLAAERHRSYSLPWHQDLASAAVLPTPCCTFPAHTSCVCNDAPVSAPCGGQQAGRGLRVGSYGWWGTRREGWKKSQRQGEEIKRDRMGTGERQPGGEGKVGNELK